MITALGSASGRFGDPDPGWIQVLAFSLKTNKNQFVLRLSEGFQAPAEASNPSVASNCDIFDLFCEPTFYYIFLSRSYRLSGTLYTFTLKHIFSGHATVHLRVPILNCSSLHPQLCLFLPFLGTNSTRIQNIVLWLQSSGLKYAQNLPSYLDPGPLEIIIINVLLAILHRVSADIQENMYFVFI
jgi:hypothetical protein